MVTNKVLRITLINPTRNCTFENCLSLTFERAGRVGCENCGYRKFAISVERGSRNPAKRGVKNLLVEHRIPLQNGTTPPPPTTTDNFN